MADAPKKNDGPCPHSWEDDAFSTHVDTCDFDLERCKLCGEYRMYIFGFNGPSDAWVRPDIAARMLAAKDSEEKKNLASDWLSGDFTVKTETGETRDGLRQGLWTEWEDGRKTGEGNYRDGLKEGVWHYWDTFGRKKSEGAYKSGKKDGMWTAWFNNGNKEEECEYREGQPHGRWVFWHFVGNKSSEGEYRNGRKHGHWTDWYEGSPENKASEGDYVDGEPHGKWTIWNGMGGVTVKEYNHGKRVKPKRVDPSK